jgi:putative endonuclease
MGSLCYLLQSVDSNRTYIGVTDNLLRRISQHNGERSGGAKATRGEGWIVVLIVTGFQTRNGALSLETLWKRMQRKRRRHGNLYPTLRYCSNMSPLEKRHIDLYRLLHPNYRPISPKWRAETLTINWLENPLSFSLPPPYSSTRTETNFQKVCHTLSWLEGTVESDTKYKTGEV